MGNTQARQSDSQFVDQRRRSIAWSFRYPGTVRKRHHPTMMVFNEKLSISDWLSLLDLQQYESNLNMYNCIEDILEFNDNELKRVGVRNSWHRTKMLSSLVGVQAKRRQSVNIEAASLPRSMLPRKNSCPPMHLSEVHTLASENCGHLRPRASHSLIRADRRRFTCDGSNIVYEEVTPPVTPTAERRDSSIASTAESNRMERGTSSSNLAACPANPTITAAPANTFNTCSSTTNEQQEALALKKALEWELSLDSRDMRSHGWYHGPLPRQRAEEIVQREGDFLIRDKGCTAEPDNYVLTCRTKMAVLHFVINKIILQPETVYERVQYQFEEDAFDAVPDLITFYVGSGKPISAASGARIQYPCNRTYPLSFYGHKIVGNYLHSQMLAGVRGLSPLNSPLGPASGSFRFVGSSTFGPQQSLPDSIPSPMSSPPRTKRDIPPLLPSKKQRSQSLTPAQAMVVSNIKQAEQFNTDGITIESHDFPKAGRRFSNSEKASVTFSTSLHGDAGSVGGRSGTHKIHMNGFQTIARCSAGEPVDHIKFTTHSLPRASTANTFRGNMARVSSLARDFPAPDRLGLASSTCLDDKQVQELPEDKPPSPPPKPARTPSLQRKERDCGQEQPVHGMQRGYQASGSDSGNGSGDSLQSSLPGDTPAELTVHRGVIIKNPRFMNNSNSSMMLKSLTEFDVVAAEQHLFTLEIPEFKPKSKFDIENFSTLLLPSVDNKPLDGDALNTFKMMILETGPKMVAEHITRIDIGLLIDEPPTNEEGDESNEQNIFQCCGLEELILPQGKAFRNDLIERTQCIKLMIAVTILTCQTDLDRAELLSKWIQIAVETKTALGNLFGFCAIMLGLCMQQIQRLDTAWHILRQKYTDSAFTFEAKLRPTLISMNECSNPQAPNTTVPHVLLYALLKDRPVIDILNFNGPSEKSSLYTTCITSWETKADDFGMSINFLHLDSARGFLKNLSLYRKNSRVVLEESNSRLDELLSDAFRTEFHVKFLWGSKGALASADDRHSKLEKVLALMTEKFCNAHNNTSAA